jgi:hypothetical protein
MRSLVAGLVLLTSAVACGGSEARPSKEYCDFAASATRLQVNFSDDGQVAQLVESPQVPARPKAELTAAVDRAKAAISSGDEWSDDDLVAVVNAMCDLSLTPVTRVP